MRVALYARYSTDLQREASIEDQLRVCRRLADKQGWVVTDSYSDRAISGASMLRPGLQELIADAGRGCFDVVIAEAMDRLSRDQEDIAGLFKRLSFVGIRIVTVSEGDISEMHIGLKGTMNALFLKDLAQKTHRGLRGRIEAGRSAGGKCYGYDVVRQIDTRGNQIRGGRSVNLLEAGIVRRIFAMTAAGMSPIAIAKTLNAEGLPGPEKRPWGDTTIRGHATRGTGVLRNELYIGRLVWNRMRFVKDPATGRRVSRMNHPDQWVIEQVPELRIVDQALWDEVKARLITIRHISGADTPGRAKFYERRRAKHILTNKVFCAFCGGTFGAIGRDHLGCNAARRRGLCNNRRSIRREELDSLILEALRNQLMAPEHVELFIAEFTAEWNRLQGGVAADQQVARRELDSVARKLNGLIEAIADGLRSPGLQQKLTALEIRKVELTSSLEAPVASTVRLLPNLAAKYREKVDELHVALRTTGDGHGTLESVRKLIDRVDVGSRERSTGLADDKTPLEITLTGEIAGMVELTMDKPARHGTPNYDMFRRSVKVVAGVGFEPTTFRL